MYDSDLPANDRRISPRFPIQASVNEYTWDCASAALALDVSFAGLAIRKFIGPDLPRAAVVGLEVELPGTREVIWASARPRVYAVGQHFQLSGLLFLDMARKHRRLLNEYVSERRERWRRLFAPRPAFTSRFGCLI